MIINVLDIETTGLDQTKGHRIIEIDMILFDSENPLANSAHYYTRINPMRSIDKAAENVHGINLIDLAGAPTWEDVSDNIVKILEKTDVAVAHNVAFDLPFLVFELLRIGKFVPNFQTFCTMENGRMSTSMGKLPSLKELCFCCQIDYDESQAHAASYDTRVLKQCLLKGIDMGMFELPE